MQQLQQMQQPQQLQQMQMQQQAHSYPPYQDPEWLQRRRRPWQRRDWLDGSSSSSSSSGTAEAAAAPGNNRGQHRDRMLAYSTVGTGLHRSGGARAAKVGYGQE